MLTGVIVSLKGWNCRFRNHWFPSDHSAKWCRRNERRNCILMMCHNPDLGSASDWLKQIFSQWEAIDHFYSRDQWLCRFLGVNLQTFSWYTNMAAFLLSCTPIWPPWRHVKTIYRVFSLTWPASTQIYCNKRKRLHKKRVQLPGDWFGTPTWPPFHCFGTPIWPPWRHVKTLYKRRIPPL